MAEPVLDRDPDARAGARILPVHRVELRLERGAWHEAERHRAEIDADFAARATRNPFLWNGRVLVLRHHTYEAGVLSGACIEVDYAAFSWWRGCGAPDLKVLNIFALPALEGADGVFVMAQMGAHTDNAGRVFFPGGTPDLSDVTSSGVVDLQGSLQRELAEETGLDAGEATQGPGWDAVLEGSYLCLMRRMVFPESGAELARRIDAFIAATPKPELARAHLVMGPGDLGPSVRPFAADYLRWRWARGRGG